MIIRSIRRYQGLQCPALRGKRVVVVAVMRGGDDGEVLRDDARIGAFQADDVVEFVEIVDEPDGRERTTWVTGDADPWDLGPPEGIWRGPAETSILMEWNPPPE